MSHRGEKGKYMVMGALSNALDLAKAAVAHDEQGALPEKVLPYYKKVCTSPMPFPNNVLCRCNS